MLSINSWRKTTDNTTRMLLPPTPSRNDHCLLALYNFATWPECWLSLSPCRVGYKRTWSTIPTPRRQCGKKYPLNNWLKMITNGEDTTVSTIKRLWFQNFAVIFPIFELVGPAWSKLHDSVTVQYTVYISKRSFGLSGSVRHRRVSSVPIPQKGKYLDHVLFCLYEYTLKEFWGWNYYNFKDTFRKYPRPENTILQKEYLWRPGAALRGRRKSLRWCGMAPDVLGNFLLILRKNLSTVPWNKCARSFLDLPNFVEGLQTSSSSLRAGQILSGVKSERSVNYMPSFEGKCHTRKFDIYF